jgi:hypothetical protein
MANPAGQPVGLADSKLPFVMTSVARASPENIIAPANRASEAPEYKWFCIKWNRVGLNQYAGNPARE